MSVSGPKGYQRDAVKNALEIFRYTESQIQAATDDASRAAASAYNGCILLEAPTGSGKTRMAGMIAEEFSRSDKHRHNAKIIWFWFTPFAGLVEQTNIAMKDQFQGLRIRDLYNERRTGNIASGDVFVTTWASVAATNAVTRRIRKNGDISVSLDEFVPMLRGLNYRIGVVVDEAHHGFTKAMEAVKVYRDVIAPDFTLLITATPDDKDVEKFREATGIQKLHRISVSRKDAVDAGLIKEGVKSVVYLAPEDQRQLVDFALTALSDAWQMHNAIHSQLAALGIDLMPLMLVQVGVSDKAVEEARKRLHAIGVPDDAVAWYTAEDQNDDLLVTAKDESKQVLIFKVAVALGFDAPRAFTLVSMRGAQDTDFGIQVVGRILRVHPALQARAIEKTLPELLRFGYVFLADAENQTGLTNAGERINSIKTEMSGICPYTMVVNVAGQNRIQVLQDGQQPTFLPQSYTPLPWVPADTGNGEAAAAPKATGLLSSLVLMQAPGSAQEMSDSATGAYNNVLPGNKTYSLRAGVPRVFKSERLPLSTAGLVNCVSATVDFSDKVKQAGLRRNVKIKRTQTEIFEGTQKVEDTLAKLSDADIARRGQNVLFEADSIDSRDLYPALLLRLKSEYENDGIDADDEDITRALYLIMVTYPDLVKIAARTCAAKYKEIYDAQSLPEKVEMPPGVKKSRLNIYGVMPQDLNGPEQIFADMLDNDTSDTVEWWFRNEPRQKWSIGIVMPNGDRYFPDFAVKVKGRTLGDGLLLVEPKGAHILNYEDTLDKVIAEHKIYGRPLMLMQEDEGRFMTVRYNKSQNKNEKGNIFRIENMAEY
jgi:type III restriction enzyme